MLQSTRLSTLYNTITSPLRGGKGGVLRVMEKDKKTQNYPTSASPKRGGTK